MQILLPWDGMVIPEEFKGIDVEEEDEEDTFILPLIMETTDGCLINDVDDVGMEARRHAVGVVADDDGEPETDVVRI